jgi:F0F1-type ATP synthase delta subunit
MELDPKTLIKIAETHTHVTHILESLENGNEIFKDHDERIRALEKQQQFMNGKLAIIIIALGGVVTLIFNLLIWVLHKFKVV